MLPEPVYSLRSAAHEMEALADLVGDLLLKALADVEAEYETAELDVEHSPRDRRRFARSLVEQAIGTPELVIHLTDPEDTPPLPAVGAIDHEAERHRLDAFLEQLVTRIEREVSPDAARHVSSIAQTVLQEGTP